MFCRKCTVCLNNNLRFRFHSTWGAMKTWHKFDATLSLSYRRSIKMPWLVEKFANKVIVYRPTYKQISEQGYFNHAVQILCHFKSIQKISHLNIAISNDPLQSENGFVQRGQLANETKLFIVSCTDVLALYACQDVLVIFTRGLT